jgi:AcrR family transcriptional regulator
VSRPRDHSIDARALDAARRITRRSGSEALTMTAVATEAGIHRAALYRRWPTLAALRFELQTNASVPPDLPDLGSIRDDLIAAVAHLVASMTADDPDLTADQIGTMIRDPAFAEQVWRRRWRPDRAAVVPLWDRAVGRGEVRSDVDGAAMIDDLVAICLFRVHLAHDPPDADAIATMVDRLLDGVRPARP